MEANHLGLLASLKGLIVAMGITTEETFEQTAQAAQQEMAQGNPVVAFYIAFGRRP